MAIKLKKFNIIIAAVILIVLILSAVVIKTITAPKKVATDTSPTPIEALPTIDSSVTVGLQFTNNNKSIILTIKNIPDGTDTIDYEISYNTAGGIPKGNIGQIKVNGQKEVERSGEELTLGTCSRGVCKYYEGVTKVSLSLKFHKTDGSASIFQKDYSL